MEPYEFEELSQSAKDKAIKECKEYLNIASPYENSEGTGWDNNILENVISEAHNAIYEKDGTFIEIIR